MNRRFFIVGLILGGVAAWLHRVLTEPIKPIGDDSIAHDDVTHTPEDAAIQGRTMPGLLWALAYARTLDDGSDFMRRWIELLEAAIEEKRGLDPGGPLPEWTLTMNRTGKPINIWDL